MQKKFTVGGGSGTDFYACDKCKRVIMVEKMCDLSITTELTFIKELYDE